MKTVKHIIFDFDGTLADSIDAALHIYNRVAPEYNCKPIIGEARELLSARNPTRYFKEYGVTPFKLFLLIIRVRKELGKQIENIPLIEGIEKSLRDLHNAGFQLGILTSNARKNVERFLAYHQLNDLFSFIYSGRHLFGKDKVIRRIIRKEKLEEGTIAYIGDETRDVLAMKKAGIPVIAVAWGLSSAEKLKTLYPNKLLLNPDELTPELITAI
jgi:phosphoglycolate phosphatase